MGKKKLWLWVVLLVAVALLMSVLATGWSVAFVHDYRKMVELAKSVKLPSFPGPEEGPKKDLSFPWLTVSLGYLGFLVALGITVLFFVRLVREMRLNHLQNEFLARVTHELKTPIAALELSSSLLKSKSVSADESAKLWHVHQSELNRLRAEVESLLQAAKLQSQGIKVLSPASVSLEGWLNDALERWKMILGPHAELIREGEKLDCRAQLDLQAFNLIMDNLFDNARKFSKDGKPRVVVRTRKGLPPRSGKGAGKSTWQIQIEDSGWGFVPSESAKLFRRFYRSTAAAPHAIPGTGLGLYLAMTASKALGLSLKAFSAGTGKGALFTIEGAESQVRQ